MLLTIFQWVQVHNVQSRDWTHNQFVTKFSNQRFNLLEHCPLGQFDVVKSFQCHGILTNIHILKVKYFQIILLHIVSTFTYHNCTRWNYYPLSNYASLTFLCNQKTCFLRLFNDNFKINSTYFSYQRNLPWSYFSMELLMSFKWGFSQEKAKWIGRTGIRRSYKKTLKNPSCVSLFPKKMIRFLRLENFVRNLWKRSFPNSIYYHILMC